MADQLQLRGGTTNEHSTFTGALREVTVDTDKDTLIVHDAATAGGHPLLREDGSNSALSLGTAGTPSIKFTGDTNTGIYSPGADQVAISTGGTGRLFIDASGNVGVGSSPTSSKLYVLGALETNAFMVSKASNVTTLDSYNYNLNIASVLTGGIGGNILFSTGSGTTAERLRIDSSGRLLVGTSTARANFVGASETTKFQIEGAVNFSSVRTDDTAYPSWLILGKTRSTGNTVVQSGDELGRIAFEGNDGSEFVDAAFISAYVDGTPGANDMPGRLVFSTTADGAQVPTERMRIDSSGRVGVGTTSPGTNLEVKGGNSNQLRINNAGEQYTTIDFANNGTSKSQLFWDNTGTRFTSYINSGVFTWQNSSSEYMRIDSSGRVGVGTSSPSAKLHVSGGDFEIDQNIMVRGSDTRGVFVRNGANTQWGCQLQGNGNAHFLGNVGVGTNSPVGQTYIAGPNSTNFGVAADAALNIAAASGSLSGRRVNLNFAVVPSATNAAAAIALEYQQQSGFGNGALIFGTRNVTTDTAPTERMRITNAGNVGIGTSSPSALLSVFQSAEGEVANFGTSDTSRLLRIVTGTANSISGALITLKTDSAEGEIAFGTGGGTERVRIDNSGNVGIGTTTPARNLHIHNSDTSSNSYLHLTSATTGTTTTDGLSIFQYGSGGLTDAVIALRENADLHFRTNDTERMRIDSSGRLLVGTSSNSQGTTLLLQGNSSGAGNNATIRMYRGSAPAADGHQLGAIYFGDGSVSGVAGGITAEQDGASWASATSRPTRLRFFTTPSGSASFQERMRIDSNGAVHIFNNIRPWSDNTSQLGTASRRWSTVFAATGTINTSDANLKQDVENLEQAELNIAIAIKGLIKKYRFIDAVQIKGDDARIHVGVIAQEVEQAFIDEGLDPRRYALFCEDTLEDGSKRLGIRYDELLAFVIAAL